MTFDVGLEAAEDASPSISTAWSGSSQESFMVDQIPQCRNGSQGVATKPIILLLNKWDLVLSHQTVSTSLTIKS